MREVIYGQHQAPMDRPDRFDKPVRFFGQQQCKRNKQQRVYGYEHDEKPVIHMEHPKILCGHEQICEQQNTPIRSPCRNECEILFKRKETDKPDRNNRSIRTEHKHNCRHNDDIEPRFSPR